MTTRHTARRSLMASILILCLCFTALIGTTFAWFTDSVTSSGNKIVAGTLKVDLELLDKDGNWNSIKESRAPVFNYDKWEPGYTDVKVLKIENEGTLALKWKAKFVSANELSALAEVIDVYVYPSQSELTYPADRNLDGYTKVGTVAEFVNSIEETTYGNLEAGEVAYLGIALKMQETAGNEYQGLDLGGAFDIMILATQLDSEEDAFGPDYDAGLDPTKTYVGDMDALWDASVNGGNIVLNNDVEVSNKYSGNRAFAVRDGVELILDLNGKEMDYTGTYQDGKNTGYTYLYTTAYNGKLVINGEGAVKSHNSEGATCIAYAQGPSEIIVNGGDFDVENGVAIWAGNNAKVTINGGSFISTGADQELIYSSGGVIDIYGGFFHNTDWEGRPVNVANANRATGFINIYGGTFVNFDPSTGGDDPNNIKVADGYIVTSEVQDNGDVWYTVVPVPDGYTAVSSVDDLQAALANNISNIILAANIQTDDIMTIDSNVVINGNGHTISRASGYTGTLINVGATATLTVNNAVLDGSGATATGNLIRIASGGDVVLNEGTVLQNNNGAHAVYLDHSVNKTGTLTLNGASIINNSSDSGAIWGGGQITVNEGSKINNNTSTGLAGAIRMVSACNLTMNGGEISGNTAAGNGGAIWGYGSSTYNFNGGKMNDNTSAGTGGAIYTGDYSVINISGDFELCNNTAANSGAIRLTDHTSMTITGGKISGNTQNGESNAFNTWNNTISITSGTLADNMSYVGGLGLTVGAADIDGVIAYDLSTNHNTAYLAAEFNSFKFTVDETDANFANFNFKPAAGYTYADGDEDKLVCMNEGYSTYWDAATGTFRLQAD